MKTNWAMLADLFAVQLAHLVMLAGSPGFREYAWHRAREMEDDESGLWLGMADALRREMLEKMKQKRSEV